MDFGTHGTAFQRRVWIQTLAIPPGTVATYKEIAERIGSPKASRAVARALAANPFAPVVPCHRVIGADRRLCGYSAPWWLERKKELLQMEGCVIDGDRVVSVSGIAS